MLGYLGKIHPIGPDHLFCGIDLKKRKIFDNTQVAVLLEYLLELGAADQVVPADLLDSHVRTQVALQVIHHPVEDLRVTLTLGCLGRLDLREPFSYHDWIGISSNEVDEEMFQV